MRLFRLWPAVYADKHNKNQDCPFKPWYYTTLEILVCADSEKHARQVVQKRATEGEWQECAPEQKSPCKEPWLYEKYTSCEEVHLVSGEIITRAENTP